MSDLPLVCPIKLADSPKDNSILIKSRWLKKRRLCIFLHAPQRRQVSTEQPGNDTGDWMVTPLVISGDLSQ